MYVHHNNELYIYILTYGFNVDKPINDNNNKKKV